MSSGTQLTLQLENDMEVAIARHMVVNTY